MAGTLLQRTSVTGNSYPGFSTLNYRLLIAALIFLIASSAVAEDVAVDAEAFSGIYVKADDSEYDYATQSFRAEGNALVRYDDISVTADVVTGNANTGDFEATGNVTFTQDDRVVKGQKFTYNYETKIGHASDASASADSIYFHGEELDSKPAGYTLKGSRFTTCDRAEPHYYLAARELIIRPNDKLIARRVRIVALGKTLFTLPKYTVSLKEGRPSGLKLPSMGISGEYGPYIAHNLDFSTNPGLTGELALRLSTREAFQGGLRFSQIAGRPLALNLTHREPYYGGRTSDTLLSRLPEVAYRFTSDGTQVSLTGRNESLYLSRAILDPTRKVESGGRIHMVGEAGVGHFKEEPSGVESTRMDLRATAWMDPTDVGGVLLTPGILTRFSHYSTGDNYLGMGLQLSAARRLGENSYVSLTYVTHAITGGTPFDFDVIEVPHELAGYLRYLVGSYTLELGARYDLQRSRMFDSEISIGRPFHCVEPRLTWRNRFREFSFGVGLTAF